MGNIRVRSHGVGVLSSKVILQNYCFQHFLLLNNLNFVPVRFVSGFEAHRH